MPGEERPLLELANQLLLPVGGIGGGGVLTLISMWVYRGFKDGTIVIKIGKNGKKKTAASTQNVPVHNVINIDKCSQNRNEIFEQIRVQGKETQEKFETIAGDLGEIKGYMKGLQNGSR